MRWFLENGKCWWSMVVIWSLRKRGKEGARSTGGYERLIWRCGYLIDAAPGFSVGKGNEGAAALVGVVVWSLFGDDSVKMEREKDQLMVRREGGRSLRGENEGEKEETAWGFGSAVWWFGGGIHGGKLRGGNWVLFWWCAVGG
ncbi:hypothetical protein HAX54_046386 [Datura stramonium]|uniref:Uncharacterized protein n=1 Tax=Datura stramonium TaxID=4076 RepID=A0ABS8WKP7_DATST|nr:hypothetical protein [Datura stramonium]